VSCGGRGFWDEVGTYGIDGSALKEGMEMFRSEQELRTVQHGMAGIVTAQPVFLCSSSGHRNKQRQRPEYTTPSHIFRNVKLGSWSVSG
jgi:hypothetical protein